MYRSVGAVGMSQKCQKETLSEAAGHRTDGRNWGKCAADRRVKRARIRPSNTTDAGLSGSCSGTFESVTVASLYGPHLGSLLPMHSTRA
jgi:hypothetical protein